MMHVLTKQEFEAALLEGLQKVYPDEEVVVHDVIKDNGHFHRGIIMKKDISVVVNVDELYNVYPTEASLDKAIACAVQFITKNSELPAGIDLDSIIDYESIKNLLIPYVMNTEMNMNLIKSNELVTLPYMDLSLGIIIYYPEAMAKIKVTQTLINKWGIPLDQVFVQAMNNIKETYRFACIDNLHTQIQALEMNDECADAESLLANTDLTVCNLGCMFVLTNSSGFFGAAHIFNTDLLNSIGEYMGMDYYIIPSSIHEIILLRCFDNGSELALLNTFL